MRFNADAEEEEPELSSDWQAEAQCHLVLARLRIRQKLWGGQSCPQPPFRRLFRAMSDFVARQGRLKAGCSLDWLPHNLCRIAMASKTKWHWASACQRPLAGALTRTGTALVGRTPWSACPLGRDALVPLFARSFLHPRGRPTGASAAVQGDRPTWPPATNSQTARR